MHNFFHDIVSCDIKEMTGAEAPRPWLYGLVHLGFSLDSQEGKEAVDDCLFEALYCFSRGIKDDQLPLGVYPGMPDSDRAQLLSLTEDYSKRLSDAVRDELCNGLDLMSISRKSARQAAISADIDQLVNALDVRGELSEWFVVGVSWSENDNPSHYITPLEVACRRALVGGQG